MPEMDKYLGEFSRVSDERKFRPKITARDAREQLLGKVDASVIHIIEAIIEMDNVRREQVRDMAKTLSRTIDLVNVLIGIMNQFKIRIEGEGMKKLDPFDAATFMERKEPGT